jgi:hypothetical protein
MSNFTLKQDPVMFLSLNLCLMYFNPPWDQSAFHKTCSMAQNWVLIAVLRICLLWCYAMCNYQLPKVSDEHSALILSRPLHLDSFTTELEALCSLKALVPIYPSSWCNIPEYLILGNSMNYRLRYHIQNFSFSYSLLSRMTYSAGFFLCEWTQLGCEAKLLATLNCWGL